MPFGLLAGIHCNIKSQIRIHKNIIGCLCTLKTVTRNNTFFHCLVVVLHNHMSFWISKFWPFPPTITNNGPDKWVAAWRLLPWGHSTEWPIDVLTLVQCWGEKQTYQDMYSRNRKWWGTDCTEQTSTHPPPHTHTHKQHVVCIYY